MELVDHPNHYNSPNRKECIVEMQERYGKPAVVAFCLLNAYKYVYRRGLKEGNSAEQDLKKARWYSDKANDLYQEMNFLDRLLTRKLMKNFSIYSSKEY